MSKKANPTSIGLFIVIGVALGVVGLLLFSSSRLFTRSIKCVLYFHGSLNGLSQGAPVKYRGVTIGSVTKVMIHFNQAIDDYTMPVRVEIREDLLQQRLEDTLLFKDRTRFETASHPGTPGRPRSRELGHWRVVRQPGVRAGCATAGLSPAQTALCGDSHAADGDTANDAEPRPR